MTTSIKAFAAFEPHSDLRIWEYEPRPLDDNDVEIEIMYCGICGSDLHTIDNGWKGTVYPVVPGHEIVGKISKSGSKVNHFKLGDIVGVGAQCGACLDHKSCKYCLTNNDQLCTSAIYTYNSKYADGSMSYGGYATHVRLSSSYAFLIPKNLPIEKIAPLFCAGITVYSPLVKFAPNKETRVGILGIGGLGHLALQFSNKMGHIVTAISHSSNKREESLKLGAHNFLLASDPNERKKHARSLDIILCTAYASTTNMEEYLNLLDSNGKFVLLAISETPMSFNATSMVFRAVSIVSSIIGSRTEIPEMLNFCANNNIIPIVEQFPMDKVNDALHKFRQGKIRYRAILHN